MSNKVLTISIKVPKSKVPSLINSFSSGHTAYPFCMIVKRALEEWLSSNSNVSDFSNVNVEVTSSE